MSTHAQQLSKPQNFEAMLNEANAILANVTQIAEAISVGDFTKTYERCGDQDAKLAVAINKMIANLKDIVKQTKRISQGRYDIELVSRGENDEMGQAMNEMILTLREMSEENRKSAWIKTGQAELSNIIRGDQDVCEISKAVLSFIAKYMGALVGTIYRTDSSDGSFLELVGSYAYPKRKGNRNRIKVGQGLVGQCALEKEMILFSNVPEGYLSISSSLGEVQPKHIVVLPLLLEHHLIGVMELGTHEEFDSKHLELLKSIGENVSIAIKSALDREKIKVLLEESKKQSEELQAQQEELRCTNEELEVQQEELKQKNFELERHTDILKKSEEEIKFKNQELQEKTEFLEKQTHELAIAKREMEKNAQELSLASKYKSEFLANMSHELRTPLNSLLILARVLVENDEKNLTPEQQEAASVIYEGGKDLLNLINDILDLSKVEAGKMEVHEEDVDVLSMLATLKRQFDPIAKNKALQFHDSIEMLTPMTVRTDSQRVEQILKNFLSNAFKFTMQGSVTLKAHPCPPETNFLMSHLNAQNTIGFSVIDTGIGIPADKQQAIFEAFCQLDGSTSRKFGGTGLGLSISREFAKLLRGEIHLKSAVDEGTIFTLYLPRSSGLQLNGEMAEMGSENAASPLRKMDESDRLDKVREIVDDRETLKKSDKIILIIEDDMSFAKILMKYAHKQDFKCLIAGTGKEGLELAKRYKPMGITLDIFLPDVKGTTVLDKLKEYKETRDIPVHIISADDNKSHTQERGAIGHLIKPTTAADLEMALNSIADVVKKSIKKVLIVEDSKADQQALLRLIRNKEIALFFAETGQEAVEMLNAKEFDCMILDLTLPDISGISLLQNLSIIPTLRLPPVIIYSAKELTKTEYQELNTFTSSFVVKGADSEKRLLDELSLFLHSIEANKRDKKGNSLPPKFSGSLEGVKVLLVDDDMRNTYALSSVLRKKGLSVSMADNGKMALDALDEKSDIEIIMMDIMMPVMDGYEAMRKIRQNPKYASVPIIALTAKTLPEDKARALDAGANDFLTKPVDVDQLLSLMKIWLSRTLDFADKA